MTAPSVPEMAATVTAVVLVFAQRELVCRVVAAVLAQTVKPGRVIVVDNGSPDGSAAAVAERFPEVEVIALAENGGVGVGHNIGWRAALADPNCAYIWALEHDCIPEPDCLAELLKVMRRITPVDGTRLPGVVFPQQMEALHRTGRPTFRLANLWIVRVAELPRTCPPLVAHFFSFNGVLLPAAVLRACGLLDESLFLGAEDIDLSFRCRQARICLLHVPAARVGHEAYRHLTPYRVGPWVLALPVKANPVRLYYYPRNSIAVFLRHTPHSRQYLLRTIVFLLVIGLRDLVFPHRWVRVQARFYALRDALQGRLGPRDYGFLRRR